MRLSKKRGIPASTLRRCHTTSSTPLANRRTNHSGTSRENFFAEFKFIQTPKEKSNALCYIISVATQAD